MATVPLLNQSDASDRAQAVFDDVKAARNIPDVNNFWKALANQPDLLEQTWSDLKRVMAPGALDPLTKEMIYIAVSVANGCGYCIHSHTAGARKAGMTDAMYHELLQTVQMASRTNALATALGVPIDPQLDKAGEK